MLTRIQKFFLLALLNRTLLFLPLSRSINTTMNPQQQPLCGYNYNPQRFPPQQPPQQSQGNQPAGHTQPQGYMMAPAAPWQSQYTSTTMTTTTTTSTNTTGASLQHNQAHTYTPALQPFPSVASHTQGELSIASGPAPPQLPYQATGHGQWFAMSYQQMRSPPVSLPITATGYQQSQQAIGTQGSATVQYQPPQQQQAQAGFQSSTTVQSQVQPPPQSSAWDMQQLQQSLVGENTSTTTQQSHHAPVPTLAPTQQAVTITEGGEARRQAASQGTQTLFQFDQLITRTLIACGTCPRGRTWYRTSHGYLCEEATCFVRHKEVDTWGLSGGRGYLRSLMVNSIAIGPDHPDFGIKIALCPPRTASAEMHMRHRMFVHNFGFLAPHRVGDGVCDCVLDSELIENRSPWRGGYVMLGEADLYRLSEVEERALPWKDG